MIGGQLIPWNTPHTQNIQTAFFFLSLAGICYHKGGKKKVCLAIQSVIDPQHTVSHSHPLTFSVRMLTAKSLEPLRRLETSGESGVTQTPCTVGAMPLLT